MQLTDELFLKFTRTAADGGVNPGLDLGLPQEIIGHASNTDDMRANLLMLYGVTRGLSESHGPPQILESGTNDGTSTLAFLKAASETGGHVTSVDIAEVPVACAIIEHLNLRRWWTFVRGDSADVFPIFHTEGRCFDVIFIDSSHTYEGTKRELAAVRDLLTPGGVLFTHDNWIAATDVNWTKSYGERAMAGCALSTKEMLAADSEWVGVVFPFGCNLGIFRRRVDCVGEIERAIEAARKQGFIP